MADDFGDTYTNSRLTANEVMRAVYKLNEVFCRSGYERAFLEDELDHARQLRAICEESAGGWKDSLCFQVARSAVMSSDQSHLLRLLLNHPALFRCWLDENGQDQ